MTNELVVYKQLDNLEKTLKDIRAKAEKIVKTLQDAEAKAERKREALEALDSLSTLLIYKADIETIRKYIEEN